MPHRQYLGWASKRFWRHALTVCLGCLLSSAVPAIEAHEKAPQAVGGCQGFVVLPNGFAVLSGLSRHMPRGHSAMPQHGAHQPGGSGAPKAPMEGSASHLLGYLHGPAIVPPAGGLCVPVAQARATTWQAVSQDAAVDVSVASLHGPLQHGGQVLAGLVITIRRDGAPLEAQSVRVLVRMPHHDRRMPGGHGPANDPDVQGLQADMDGPGRYTVPGVDFTMGGPWLLELHIQDGTVMRKAYVTTLIGEE
ncbi:MAG: hypothetical protein FJZ47_04720 [Candidatus Tectomicrobia bacterium]|uniref:YtkA-like domain-containing protein n=1 Tax=Tectimicrobiota bacterium TaxID=2528274 RepID=A0A938AZX5_UNCTE|nr:hypothetical protein [Candidatus Tectomicrobia bacterium]